MGGTNPGTDDGYSFAVPGVCPGAEREPHNASFTLEVDGQMFAIRSAEDGGTHYTWLTGPNKSYGFGLSPTPNWSLEEHRASIRGFLAQVDATTGYIEDD